MTHSELARRAFPVLLLTPFIGVFLRAGYMEVRRWWLYGASGNKRSAFPTGRRATKLSRREGDDRTDQGNQE